MPCCLILACVALTTRKNPARQLAVRPARQVRIRYRRVVYAIDLIIWVFWNQWLLSHDSELIKVCHGRLLILYLPFAAARQRATFDIEAGLLTSGTGEGGRWRRVAWLLCVEQLLHELFVILI